MEAFWKFKKYFTIVEAVALLLFLKHVSNNKAAESNNEIKSDNKQKSNNELKSNNEFKMECYVSKYSGFCFGVTSAVKAAYTNLETPLSDKSLYMYGEIINNPVVISELQNQGIKLINNIDEVEHPVNSKVLIRAHGVPEHTIDSLKRKGASVIDKTCPRVKNVHRVVRKAAAEDYDVILVGDSEHPEIIGTIGWCKTRVTLIENLEHAKQIMPDYVATSDVTYMVSQTTYNSKSYEEIVTYCSSLLPSIKHHYTICNVTSDRQTEIRELAKGADFVLIVGGKASANSTELFTIASEYCPKTQHVESEADIDISMITGVSTLVICSGASTPDTSIEACVKVVETACHQKGVGFELINLKTKQKNIEQKATQTTQASAGAASATAAL